MSMDSPVRETYPFPPRDPIEEVGSLGPSTFDYIISAGVHP